MGKQTFLAYVLSLLACSIVLADDAFEAAARVLERRCLQCHAGDGPKGGLSLATRSQVIAGGESGPAIIPSQPAESLVVQYVSGDEPLMPQGGPALETEEVAALQQWIAAGAPWPEGQLLVDRHFEDSNWWSLRALKRPAVPEIESAWIRTPVDAFVLAKMIANGLEPSPEADRRTLIRRLSFDLVGLPPTPQEVAEFVNDTASDAYERLVRRLLSSPHYGERWGRHWLDVVHFGETHGYDKDKVRPNAWHYRDYVIQSLNADKPYSRFVQEQLAGDVLWPDDHEATIATGFIVAGPWDFVGHVELREGTVAKEITRSLDRDDMVTTAMSTFLSLTVHCARCHDHKFDPIAQQDYYALQAVFAGVERGDRPFGTEAEATELTTATNANGTGDAAQTYAAKPIAPRPIHLLARGDVTQPKHLVSPAALRCLKGLSAEFELPQPEDEGARRVALARWITAPHNGLSRRSIVNRVWQFHFGQGLCSTPNDFGRMGAEPSHPELLDWLASQFQDSGESLKQLHELIVNSAAYRQASTTSAEYEKIDSAGRYLWRFPRRRLDAESVRDSMLAVSGKLDFKMGGPSDRQFFFKDDHSPVYDYERMAADDPANFRRSVYRFLVRSVPDPFMECLDCADPSLLVPQRSTTLTALQALALLNNQLVLELSQHFAQRIEAHSADDREQVRFAVQLAFAREPTQQELVLLRDYARQHGHVNLCRLLFNSNEFVFID